MARELGKSLLGLVTVLLFAPGLAAQDPDQLFKEAVTAYRLGKLDDARQKLEAVLAADPSNEDAFRIWQSAEQAVWHALLVEKGEIGKMARFIIERARAGRRERSRDEARIEELVEKAVHGETWGERRKAQLELMAHHGEFAVPALVRRLANADDEKGQINAILALATIGREATLALVAALDSDSVEIRRNAAAALGQIEDPRAAAALAAHATDPRENETVRETARRVLASMGIVDPDPRALYLADARRYLTGSGLGAGETSGVVWSWRDGKLVAADVPAEIYNFELAKAAAHAAVALDPASDAAQTVLARAYLGEAAAIGDSIRAGGDQLRSLEPKVAELRIVAAASGPAILGQAVQDSIADGLVPMAVAAIELLGEVVEPSDLASSPLVGVLDHSDKRLAYAAALAIAHASRGRDVPAADKVVTTLAKAVGEEAIRRIEVVDATPASRRAAVEASSRRGFAVGVAEAASKAIDELYRFPNVDVVVVNEILPDARPEAIIGLIKKDPRMADVKILVVSKDPDAAAERFGDKVDGVIKGPLSAGALQQEVDKILGDRLDANRAYAEQVARDASQALELLAASRVQLDAALDDLAAQLDRSDAVAIPAARALGLAGGQAQVEPLTKALAGSGSLELKIACADALGHVFARGANAPFDALLAVVASGADVQLRGAVVRALGKAALEPAQKLKLVEALRVWPLSVGSGSE